MCEKAPMCRLSQRRPIGPGGQQENRLATQKRSLECVEGRACLRFQSRPIACLQNPEKRVTAAAAAVFNNNRQRRPGLEGLLENFLSMRLSEVESEDPQTEPHLMDSLKAFS
eukprot:TRINITY_DN4547_c1_g2_i1.p1 TRINITY_DN4547_c1_g2~~TRINITY_DN4547_c1_g2_i1.p1  ORF type:complete len:112 (+),score=8.94 TRINITY_DN4547_c1_g2_i1:875-1210(+)